MAEEDKSWVAELAHETFAAVLSFYDKNPVIASIGFLLLLGSLPLYLLLRYASNIRRLDNETVVAKLKLQLEHGDGSKAKHSTPTPEVETVTTTTTSSTGG
ncbi:MULTISPECIES: hypothetical protein [Klebsiella]|uniref:hypothetical protein n=1 Tax=Klebsiella TaxID=570 RepID=UPI0010345E19|nr:MULTISPECIES: hypothetical protein [Klebsiella]HBQ3115397.1 hypothetical protein [Klebsiella quasipneumoniae subsp. similipneumoniae]HCT8863634.1 hypothetical protein [Klebsiella variicola]EIW0093149.1 hypothetical protein [Klebsiella pneumoniae]EKZ6531781.1 hypothetical protein [Klebsiella pneumoniae]MBC5169841.1 hypothetical protein [Klebsiella pneumoniae]